MNSANAFRDFHLAQDAKIITDNVPGEQSQKILDYQTRKEGSIVSYPKRMPIAIRRSKGSIIEDVDENLFIDFFSGAGVLNVGQCNPYVLERVKEQQEQLIHALDFPTENKMQLIEKILNMLPASIREDYKVSFCGPSGSDVIEAAIKLAKIKTQREGIIAFHGSYHGMTATALSATSDTHFRREVRSLVPNVNFIPYSYCYRCPFGKESESCSLNCADYLEYVLTNPHSGQPKPAAILLEPVQGEGGTVVPKKGFLERIVEIAKANEVLVIFDEVQCGFFRTGEFLAFQSGGAVPDIITMSKGLGGIGFPISAIIYKKEIEAWKSGDHIGTFRGNQVSIAAGNAAFDFIRDYDVANHTREISDYLFSQLTELKELFPAIGDVRRAGLMIGIEYVQDPDSKRPAPQVSAAIREACFKTGLLFEIGGHYGNVIRFLPALIINREIVDNAMRIFRNAHHQVMKRLQTNLTDIPEKEAAIPQAT
ncbi:MAG: aspartate aminotransferase family protein [Chryseotalea sp. WA131a]|nr:MAG: aspartate aminotransferase family protein [Chryseotalea sp. WA131a]